MENLNSSYNGFQKKSFQDNINTININIIITIPLMELREEKKKKLKFFP